MVAVIQIDTQLTKNWNLKISLSFKAIHNFALPPNWNINCERRSNF